MLAVHQLQGGAMLAVQKLGGPFGRSYGGFGVWDRQRRASAMRLSRRLPVHQKPCATCAGSRPSRPAALENGKVSQYQVTLKVGFTMED
jgi:hypothetical protein